MTHTYAIARLLDLQGSNFEVVDIQVSKAQILWKIKHKDIAVYECARCHLKWDACFDRDWIRLLDVPFGARRCVWEVYRARVLCTCSAQPRVEYLFFRSGNHRLTQRFVNLIEATLCSKMFTVADTARLFSLDYSVVYKIDHEVLLRIIQFLEIPDPINIAVDEKSFLKGHNYVTIVTDTDLRKVIWVSAGNSRESLDSFFLAIGPERCKKIKTVSKDLHRPYALSCAQHIPHALEVADPFHVVQRLNQVIDECRKELSVGSKLQVNKRKVIHNMQWILRYKQGNQTERGLESLEALAKINEPLYKAYLHKEAFYAFFEFRPDQIDEANRFLIRWLVDAMLIKLKPFTEFAHYITRNVEVLLNIVRTQRNSAVSEGINRKISVIKAMAYGYRNINYFMLKIMQRCGVLGSMYQPAPT